MRRTGWKVLGGILTAVMLAGEVVPISVKAAVGEGWEVVDGNYYWYENGIKQGTEGRGKEIYDPASDAWYWLDAVDGGKKATSKDLYQESAAGDWAENKETGMGKWVRYDENGHMIKGWYTNEKGIYYFDLTYGTMAKGTVTIEGNSYTFDATTGILQSGSFVQNGWVVIDDNWYWYENGVKQGIEGRGKEIFDPSSNAWYWLDAVENGKKTTSKDVYQESDGGKWVRYDENGHMIKGWSEQDGKKYYFDPITGAMQKGLVIIEGTTYSFNETTGILEQNSGDKQKEELDNEENKKREEFVKEVVRLINVERVKAGLGELVIDTDVKSAAQKRAEELLTTFSHTRPDGSRCFSVLGEYNVSYKSAGENIAAGYSSPEAVVEAWMNSTGHRANILGDYTHIGVGYKYQQGVSFQHYWTQLFIKK